MFHVYKIKEDGQIFTNPVELPDNYPFEVEYLGTSEQHLEQGRYELVDGQWQRPDPGSVHHRKFAYPKISEQLDKLWHDIDLGLFGETAKTGCFYQGILAIKQQFPKNG